MEQKIGVGFEASGKRNITEMMRLLDNERSLSKTMLIDIGSFTPRVNNNVYKNIFYIFLVKHLFSNHATGVAKELN